MKLPYRQPCFHGWGGIQYVGMESIEEGICCSEEKGERLYIAVRCLYRHDIQPSVRWIVTYPLTGGSDRSNCILKERYRALMGDDLFRSSINLPQMERNISPGGELLIGVTEFTMCRLVHLV